GDLERRGRRGGQGSARQRRKVHAAFLQQVAPGIHPGPPAPVALLVRPGVFMVTDAVLGVQESADMVLHGAKTLRHLVAEGLHGGKSSRVLGVGRRVSGKNFLLSYRAVTPQEHSPSILARA